MPEVLERFEVAELAELVVREDEGGEVRCGEVEGGGDVLDVVVREEEGS